MGLFLESKGERGKKNELESAREKEKEEEKGKRKRER